MARPSADLSGGPGIPTVFLSYGREDLEYAGRIAEQLAAAGVRVWRDQEQLYVGQAWPKALGEAIAVSDAVLLLWSGRAAGSPFVELEWCTALALKKTILPCLLDQTPLPPSLVAIEAADPDGIAAAVRRFVAAHTGETKSSGESHTQIVVGQLAEIGAGTPGEVLQKAKTVFAQRNWMVQGPVYQAVGDIHIGTPPGPKNKLEKWQAWVAIIAGILMAVSLGLALVHNYIPALKKQETTVSPRVVNSPQVLAGAIGDDVGEPVANVKVSVVLRDKVAQETTTDSGGHFRFQPIDGQPEDTVYLLGQKDGYQTEKRYTHLGNPGFNFVMRRKQ